MNYRTKDFFKSLHGKKIALCGIGASNLPLIQKLTQQGAHVIACDKKSFSELEENAVKAEKYGAQLRLGEDYLKDLNVDIVVRTPGMRFYLPELIALKNKGVIITSEMELFFDLCPCLIIAVTGSDGKTTTTTIIAEFLKEAGFRVHLGGNIGQPLFSSIETMLPDDIAVAELSSFQLISMRRSPDIAVITNITPNHLDMHKDMNEYVDAKKNILLHQGAFSKAVLNLDNDITNSLETCVRGTLVKFSHLQKPRCGAYVKNGKIFYSNYGHELEIMYADQIKIPGLHNVQNYLAAISAVWDLVSLDIVKKVAKNFSGVEHRAEFVREVNGVKYYNDSIASSPTRTVSGTLSLYDRKIILIAGGYDKNISYAPLGPVICDKVKLLILMGNTADKILESVITSENYRENQLRICIVKNMEEAVKTAFDSSKQGDIVSMSPASASFDLYKNFDERGKHFKMLVNSL